MRSAPCRLVIAQHQHGLRAGGHQVLDHPQGHAFAVDHVQSHQIHPVELAIVGLGKGRAPQRRGHRAGPRQRCGQPRLPQWPRWCRSEARLLDGQQHGAREMLGAFSAGCKTSPWRQTGPRGAAEGMTLNQPLMPQASAMRPTSMASAGKLVASRTGMWLMGSQKVCRTTKKRAPSGKPTEPVFWKLIKQQPWRQLA
jgi:hypothetical protein